MATCLVTGGAGFLGSHLCDELLRRGHRVICVDNLETGSLREHRAHPRARVLLPADRHHRAVLRRRAGRLRLPPRVAGVADRLPAPAAAHAEGRLARHAPHARPGQGATARASCSPRRARSTATRRSIRRPRSYWGHVNPIGPRGVYDEAKRYAEALTMAYHRQQGVDTAIVRIFNTYGPRMRPHDGRAIPTFLRQALTDRPITVFGDGSQTRSFCYVDDLIRGMIALAESGQHDPVNIGNPDEFTLLRARRDGHRGDRLASRRSSTRRCRPTTRRSRQPDITPRPRAARLGAQGRAARRSAAHDRPGRRRRARRRRDGRTLRRCEHRRDI